MTALDKLADLVKAYANAGRRAIDAAAPASTDLELWSAARFAGGVPRGVEPALRGALVRHLLAHEEAMRAALAASEALRAALAADVGDTPAEVVAVPVLLAAFLEATGAPLVGRRKVTDAALREWSTVFGQLGPGALLEVGARAAMVAALRLEATVLRRAADAADALREAAARLPPQGGPRA